MSDSAPLPSWCDRRDDSWVLLGERRDDGWIVFGRFGVKKILSCFSILWGDQNTRKQIDQISTVLIDGIKF